MNKKILLASLLSVVTLVGCVDPLPPIGPGSSPSEPQPSEPSQPGPSVDQTDPSVDVNDPLKDDLKKSVELKLSVNYDKATTMKYTETDDYVTPAGNRIKTGDWKPVWKEIQNKLNLAINDVSPTNGKAVDEFKNTWKTNQFADIACANLTDIVSVSVETGTLLDLNEYLEYLPNFSAFLEDNPAVSRSITTAKYGDANASGVYFLPYFDGYDDLEKMTLVRADYIRKILDDEYDATKDTAAGDWTTNQYTATVADAAYSVEVPKGMDQEGTKVINKAEVKNIVTQQNELAAGDRTGAKMVKQLRDYIDARYGSQFAKRSDLFLGVDSCYDADEMIALMRVVRNSPELLTGSAATEMIPFVPREYNNQRIADMYRWAGQLWGVRGVESRMGYFYIDKDGNIQDARGDAAIADMIENLNKLYNEGLILKDFHEVANYGTTKGTYAASVIVGGNPDYQGFMEYDYAQTQGAWNDYEGSLAVDGYDFRPILGGVAKWDDGDAETNYFHFTESWRSVKTQGWCLNASLAEEGNEAKLARALSLVDFFYSYEGQMLNSYGPESEGYTDGTITYMGREIPKCSEGFLEQLATLTAGNYTNYLRKYVGASLPIGYVKEQGMEYQCTSDNAKFGLEVINKAIEEGTYKHLEVADAENPFYQIVPSAFLLTKGDSQSVTEYEKNLGVINNKSNKEVYNEWDYYVLHGFGGTKGTGEDAEVLNTKAQYLAEVNETWELAKLVKIYRDAYSKMIL